MMLTLIMMMIDDTDSSSRIAVVTSAYKVFTIFCGDKGLAIVRSRRDPAAAIRGTAKQQSQSSVLASLTRRILSYGCRTPSQGPPGRKQFM